MTTAVTIHSIDDIERMANAIAKSGLFGIKEPLQALALMLMAQAEGQHPATIAQDYDIISGRAARKTHSVLSRFQAAGGKVRWITLTDDCAKAEFTHPAGGSVTIDWDMARAARTKVYNNKKNAYESLADRQMYQSYSRSMLRARCIGEGVRAVYPAALGGMLVSEEAMDPLDHPEKDITPPVVSMPKAAAPALPPVEATVAVAAEPEEVEPPPQSPQEGEKTPEMPPEPEDPAAASSGLTAGQCRVLLARLKANKIPIDEFRLKFGHEPEVGVPIDINVAMAFARTK